jgi:hypothetical protein
VQTSFQSDGFGWAGRVAWWLDVSVSTLVVGLVLLWLLKRGAGRIVEMGQTGIVPGQQASNRTSCEGARGPTTSGSLMGDQDRPVREERVSSPAPTSTRGPEIQPPTPP